MNIYFSTHNVKNKFHRKFELKYGNYTRHIHSILTDTILSNILLNTFSKFTGV